MIKILFQTNLEQQVCTYCCAGDKTKTLLKCCVYGLRAHLKSPDILSTKDYLYNALVYPQIMVPIHLQISQTLKSFSYESMIKHQTRNQINNKW